MDMNYGGECGREGGGQCSGWGKWDNCNSIINKYIKKKKKKKKKKKRKLCGKFEERYN